MNDERPPTGGRRKDEDVPADLLRKSLPQSRELVTTFNRAWPLIEAADLVGDLWSVPAYLRRCAPRLSLDLVVLIDPGTFGDGIEGAVDRYVAMTRATQQLVILTSSC